MRTAGILAGIDALVGLYLITYGMARERRDVVGVIIVGGTLMACAVALSFLTLTGGT